MKQNIYDDPVFFEKYKDLRDNDKGINEWIEQPVMRQLMKIPAGAHVLDIGCGLGHQISYLLQQSPASIIGVDIAEKMLAEVARRIQHPTVELICSAIEDYPIRENHFDLIVSSMTLHYVQDLPELFRHISKGLKPGGQFIFSMEHPVCTAWLKGWIEAEGTKIWPVAEYAREGIRYQHWFVADVIKYHRKLSTIINDLIRAGFQIDHIAEPVPTPEVLVSRPDLAPHLERPPVLIIGTTRQSSL
ncbi:class I SAM-dependent methyltransferase [Chitinophaga nivalis]|uniref:Class I SAM-dependent methyltransferase n=1 Tax=Chitinophaga nivalis TaxID=2991709 RepID=A0ABT3IQD5_9BACT|nr:class I SAM-dependent methyltransferase [Chitinophaga nivalis]MCW3464360.1 class I SAM-dependent methyltransferase [Chitinophaga nivalis]MCW3485949.1 class I SAM-dependent methyltransferase [Chitinophaga nivalis]